MASELRSRCYHLHCMIMLEVRPKPMHHGTIFSCRSLKLLGLKFSRRKHGFESRRDHQQESLAMCGAFLCSQWVAVGQPSNSQRFSV